MNQKTVLIIEDDAANREVYATILEHNGYGVLEAGSGDEGLRLARERSPDVILINMVLPVMNGWDALEELHSDPETADTPCVVATGVVGEGQKAVDEIGCDSFLPKPHNPKDVVAEVRRLIGPAESD